MGSTHINFKETWEREMVQEAAEATGRTLSGFIRFYAIAAANNILAEAEDGKRDDEEKRDH